MKNITPAFVSPWTGILPMYRIQADAEAEAFERRAAQLKLKLRQACHRANTSKDRYEIRNAIRDADDLRDELTAMGFVNL